MSRWIVLALLAMGCGHPSRPPEKPAPPPVVVAPSPPAEPLPLDRDLPKLVERTLGMYGGLATALTSSCAEAVPQLAALADSFGDVVAATHKIALDGRTPELRAALASKDGQLADIGRRIMTSPAIATCSGDPAFTAAIDKLVGGDPPAGASP